MKTLIKILAIVVVLNAGVWITPTKTSAQVTSVSFQIFYDELSPHGMWVDYQSYGYVWIPDLDYDFAPYGTGGYWVFTEYGWTWVSTYSWGWAPFHYGRWAYDDLYGWLWVPDNVWGPAWVSWRSSPGYYGWAPMGPGISIEVSFGGGYRVPNERWIFVSDRYITSREVNRYYVDRSTNVTIINNSTVINNTYVDNSRKVTYVAGPPKDDVQKVTGATIKPVAVRENDKPGQALANNELKIYRPQVKSTTEDGRKPAPSKVMNLKEVKPRSELKQGNQQRDVNTPEKKEKEQQQANPPERKQKEQQVTPPEKKEREQQQQQANPPERKQKEQQVNPPEKKEREQQANPPEKKEKEQQQRDVTAPEKKGKEQVNPPEKKESTQQPPAVKSPEKKKTTDQQPPKKKTAPVPKKKTKPEEPPKPKKDDQ